MAVPRVGAYKVGGTELSVLPDLSNSLFGSNKSVGTIAEFEVALTEAGYLLEAYSIPAVQHLELALGAGAFEAANTPLYVGDLTDERVLCRARIASIVIPAPALSLPYAGIVVLDPLLVGGASGVDVNQSGAATQVMPGTGVHGIDIGQQGDASIVGEAEEIAGAQGVQPGQSGDVVLVPIVSGSHTESVSQVGDASEVEPAGTTTQGAQPGQSGDATAINPAMPVANGTYFFANYDPPYSYGVFMTGGPQGSVDGWLIPLAFSEQQTGTRARLGSQAWQVIPQPSYAQFTAAGGETGVTLELMGPTPISHTYTWDGAAIPAGKIVRVYAESVYTFNEDLGVWESFVTDNVNTRVEVSS